jgi:hypothetical protein
MVKFVLKLVGSRQTGLQGAVFEGVCCTAELSFDRGKPKSTLLTVNGPQAWTYTENHGSFEFLNLIPGNYEVQIETIGVHYQVVSQAVQVLRGAPSMMTISLSENPDAKPKTGNSVVSVNELNASIPKAARKEFMLAGEAGRNHKTDEAIVHLRKAIAIYPHSRWPTVIWGPNCCRKAGSTKLRKNFVKRLGLMALPSIRDSTSASCWSRNMTSLKQSRN